MEGNQRHEQRTNPTWRRKGVSSISSADVERLSKLLGEELEFYRKIRKLTEEQVELLDKDDIEAFNSSLDKREQLIEKIKGLHQDKGPLMQSYASMSEGEKDKNSDIDSLNKQIREMIKVCAELNDRNVISMKEKTESHVKRIDEQRAKGKGIGGYVQSVPNNPEMFDKKT